MLPCLSGDYFVNIVCPARVGPPMAPERAEVLPKCPMSSHHAPAPPGIQQWPASLRLLAKPFIYREGGRGNCTGTTNLDS